ncbi:MAG: hypothetical protein JHC33_03845 [Ignisphaera sp.]|nr:hypothetical protein [Ignisphaera sp.]
MTDVSFSVSGVMLAEKTDKILLVDADTIAFATCSVCEYPEYLVDDAESMPTYDEKEGCVWHIDLDKALNMAMVRIEEILDITGCSSAELYFSSGRTFRHDLTDSYKANRNKTRYPVGLSNLKDLLLEKHAGEICKGYEADDVVVMLKEHYPDKYILAAVDKDVLNSVPGKHFDYYRGKSRDMGWVEVTEDTAAKWPYIQCISGDATDGIKGVPGLGPVKAKAIISKLTDTKDMWDAVVAAYKKAKLDESEAILNMRLVNMHQLNIDREINLF